MSEDGGTGRVLATEITSLDRRVTSLETMSMTRNEQYTQIMVQIAELKTRVGVLAAGIGAATGVLSSLLTKYLV